MASGFSGSQAADLDVLVCGSLNVDLISRVPHLPATGETLAARELLRLPGGKGLNQAVAAARQQARVAMLGATGDDDGAVMLRGVLRDEGVVDNGVSTLKDFATGMALVHVADDAENVIVTHAGANAAVTAELIRQAMVPAKVYLAQLEVPVAALTCFFEQARLRGGCRILNAAPATTEAHSLLEQIDILVVNEGELRAFCDAETLTDAARRLLNDTLQTVIVTLGARGALRIDARAQSALPAAVVEAVDTTGAGDCFCGVLAAAVADGLSLTEAAARAVTAATEAVQAVGAMTAMPRRRDQAKGR